MIALAPVLETTRLADYLAGVFHEPVEVVGLRALGGEAIEDPKGFGYGVPVQVDCRVAGALRSAGVKPDDRAEKDLSSTRL